MVELTPRLSDGFALVLQLQGQQTRKGKSTPYLAHLLSVCALVLEDGGSEDEAIAALLHDVLEDCPGQVTSEQLEQHFGRRVQEIVLGCTDTPPDYTGGPKPDWYQRKRRYIEHLRGASAETRRVALADKVHNLRDMLTDCESDPLGPWRHFKTGRSDQLWFYHEVEAALTAAGTNGRLMIEYRTSLARLRAVAEAE